MKIAIIGFSGSGKSTLAKKLAEHYSIAKLHMDTLQFLPQWQENDRRSMKQQMEDFLVSNSSWVIDGNNSWCFYEERMKQADWIIFMNFSPWNCLWRAFKRYLTYRHQLREDRAAGCPEKLDWEFILWILKDGRSQKALARYQSICQTYPEKMIILHHQKEINSFLSNL